MNPFSDRVADLLTAAREARRAGDATGLRALANAVLALDPGNTEAEDLLVGSARRRQMTLMFCDVVGSTAIADARDPEETTRILRNYRRLCTDVVARHRGFIQDHQGDGMLVLFGYPDVDEDDVHRAVLCGLEIVGSLREHKGDDDRLHVRIAVHTDLVIVDGFGVSGATSNEAARIQAIAAPDTVVISDATESIVRGWFDVHSLGPLRLRGVEREIEVFTVLGARNSASLRGGSAASPFTGRRSALARIEVQWTAARSAWREAAQGTGRRLPQGVLVTGPAGVGKTRLLGEVVRLVGAPCTDCSCSRYQTATSLYPLRPALEAACGIGPTDPDDERLAKLRSHLERHQVLVGDLPFLAAALRIPLNDLAPPPEVDAQLLRDIALQVAAAMMAARSDVEPAIVVVDDLQWADRSTLDLLQILLASPHPGLLVLLAARDGFAPPWPPALVTTLPLDRLPDADLRELAGRIMANSPLSDEQRAEVIERSDGIPLFLEELVRTAEALEQNRVIHRSIRFSDYQVPAALRDPLLARLASPGVDLDLAQLAATIGRDIDRGLLRRVADRSDPELDAAVASLVEADVVEPIGKDGIRFRHELIREVAYETQPHAARRERHSGIADFMLADSAVTGRVDAGPITFHLDRAGRYEEAIGISVRAAQSDQELGAHGDATRRLTQALEIVAHLPEGPNRERTERAVRELRSFSAVMSDGYAAPEAAEDHRRCVELCEQAGLAEELLPSLVRSWSYFAFRGELSAADRVTDRIAAVGPGEAPTLIAIAFRSSTAFFRGRFDEARRLMHAFVDHPWTDPPGAPPSGWPLPNDPLVAVLALLAPNLWILGDRAGAETAGKRGMRRAHTLPFPFGPFSVGYAASLVALTRRMAGDHDAAARLADELIGLGERHGFVLWGLTGSIQRGLSVTRSGGAGAMERLAQDVMIWRMMLVADLWTPYWLTELAEVQLRTGDAEAALASLNEALTIAAATGVSFYTAVTLRLRGETRWALGDPEGTADIDRALELAAGQGATAFVAMARDSLERVAVR